MSSSPLSPVRSDSTGSECLPPAARRLFEFQISNACSWSILLAYPMVLYFKYLGASVTMMGVVMGVTPFLTVLQIPAAGYVERIGYRRFVFTGWMIRTVVSLGMAAVAIATPWLNPKTATTLMLGLLSGFAMARGISSTGVLPWFTQLIPPEVRGRYLSLEQSSIPMLTDVFHMQDGNFMLLHAVWSCASVLILFGLRGLLDRVGSKPLLQTSILLQFFHFSAWGLVAAGVLPLNLGLLAFTQLSWGCVHALYQASNMRLVMGAIPSMGRSHFFAAYSVAVSLASGLFPVFWGWVIDALEPRSLMFFGREWSHFSLIYFSVSLVALSTTFLLSQVQEANVMSIQHFLNELLIKTPARGLSRITRHRPYFR